VPKHLALAAAPGPTAPRLYCVEETPGPEVRNPGSVDDDGQCRLVGLNPVTLETESALLLLEEPAALAFTPEGNDAYVRPLQAAAGRSAVPHVDLATGRTRPLIALPGESVGDLVLAGERLYVPHARGSAVWAADRRRGRLAQTIAVGRSPQGLALAPGDPRWRRTHARWDAPMAGTWPHPAVWAWPGCVHSGSRPR
jgi:hypothetical protein